MITYSGQWMRPDTKECPTPTDIAVHMGRICRYGGARWFPLLAHSVLVGEFAAQKSGMVRPYADASTWAWALLHDAHEAVTSDVPRNWKPKEMKVMQKELDARIMESFRLDPKKINFEIVKECDELALLCEAELIGLDRFPERYCAEAGIAEYPKPPAESVDFARRVMESDFWKPGTCTNAKSDAVVEFSNVLWCIQYAGAGAAYEPYRRMINHYVGGREKK